MVHVAEILAPAVGLRIVENGKLYSATAASQTTNNRMELTAAIKALESARKDESLYLYTDSTYLQKGITEWIVNWKKNNWITARRNQYLIRIMDKNRSIKS